MYDDMRQIIRDGMARADIPGPAALRARLRQRGVSVHINAVRRWIAGDTRPRGVRLERLLDVLGVVHPDARQAAREAAYMPKLGDE